MASKVATVVATFFVVIGMPSAQAATGQPSDFLRKVNVREVEVDLQASLSDVLGGAKGNAARRLADIEAITWQTFQALPKNSAGRLAPPAVRYIVHGYFAKEHGWLIKGLEPHGMQADVTQVHDVSILQDRVPLLVEQLLEVRQGDRGLAHSDVVAMVAVLEQLMFDESVTLLEAAYKLNGLSVADEINEPTLHKVLQSYLLLFGQGSKADLSNGASLQKLLQSLSQKRPDIVEFENDAVLNLQYANRHHANPFKAHRYSFQAAAKIMEDLAQRYGKWQNAECRDMKAHLAELDTEGSGRVPLGLFYAQPKGAAYHFSESSEYLRKIGALDEVSSQGMPQVVIPNYVAGPSNCIASSSYYSVCCLSECEGIFSELEHQVLAPTASPERLLTLVRNMSDATLPQGLPEKLHAIAKQHGGEVPLHGRLFAQWLHFAFPHECPYPSVLASAEALTPSQWLGGQSVASVEEREQHLVSPVSASPSNLKIEELWSDHEVLPVHEPSSSPFQMGKAFVRMVVMLAAILVVLRGAQAAWSGAVTACDGSAKKKDDDYISSLHV